MTKENVAERKMAALMEEVVTDLGGVEGNDNKAPYHAMVRIWRALRDDKPLHDLAIDVATRNEKATQQVRMEVADALSEGRDVRRRLANASNGHPGHVCAFLQGIEDYLERWDGQVTWAAPPPLVRFDGQRYWVFARSHERAVYAPLAKQPDKLEHWLVRHWIVPIEINGIQVQRTGAARGALGELLARARTGAVVKICVVSFTDGVEPKWPSSGGFLATELTDSDHRWGNVTQALEKALQEKAHIVIFPELTIPDTLREQLCQWLDSHRDHPFLLVLAGSFHVTKKDGRVYNETQLLDRDGGLVLSHTKLTPYVDVKSKRTEGITLGNQLSILDTPLGSFVVPICKDFCDAGTHIADLWRYVGADWILVPAFGDASSIHAHEDRAREVWIRFNSVCVIANQHPEGKPGRGAHGFIANGATGGSKTVCPGAASSSVAYACKVMRL